MVALAGIMFVAFVIQIFSRYVLNAGTDWTHEIILITWLWLIFWGAAFFLEDKDHVKFDVLYNLGGEKARRTMALITAIAMVVGFGISVPATWDFIDFKKIRGTDHFQIPMNIIFGVYMIFLAGTIIHYGLRAWRLIRGDSLAQLEKEEEV
ncbi:MAG: TRAP transporter small permease subunit [Proteobacteria bacterium]|nr:TRAP transporter small permease subunit [Pseudomonadota bacterium]